MTNSANYVKFLDPGDGSFLRPTLAGKADVDPAGYPRPSFGGAVAFGPGTVFDVGDVAATVWASSLDGKPIAQSARLLVTHLTDVQADGNVYADRDKRILLKWGAYPPVVRAGQAKVSLALNAPDAYDVWALDTTGRRQAKLPASVTGGRLAFTADVKGSSGAQMLYEVVRR